ncbi:MAG: carboxypeptidase-like regulatory domain-containing protein [Terracidiphilus sp.]|nr:carboxypeptidase-like regulatory domain-containing protein [Terracidiphilus sp.]
MKSSQIVFRTFAITLPLFLAAAFAQATSVTGTVTNKTTGKPAAGDPVVLVDVQAGMGEVAHATTDAKGRYSLVEPGSSPYLVRATHQGATYFVAAPQGAAPADITVFDVAPKVQGVSIEADVLEIESDNGLLRVAERFFVHNNSMPPTTQWSAKSFEVVLPADAVIDGVGGQRPNGLPTTIKIDPDGPKGHYSFNFPIQPDDGDKDTLFQLSYHLPYASGKYAFHAQLTLPADNLAVLMPKSMTFTATSGDSFKGVPEDPNIQTFVLKNAAAGKPIDFTIAGTGSMPREQQGAAGGQQPAGMGAQDASGSEAGTAAPGSTPGGGIGTPINTPDPLSKYKWWILGGLGLLLAAAAAFLLRKPTGEPSSAPDAGAVTYPAFGSPAGKNSQLLGVLKEEMFALESEKINGSIEAEEYAKIKAALETVLKRALNRK